MTSTADSPATHAADGIGQPSASSTSHAPAPLPPIPQRVLDVQDKIARFVREPLALPRWVPKPTWGRQPGCDADDIARLADMDIPVLPFGNDKPDMLLYQLGQLHTLDDAFPERLEDFVSGNNHLLLVNQSGTGKTRLLFETLYRHWGLYLTCASDINVNPYGSADLDVVLSQFKNYADFHNLFPLNARSRKVRQDILHNQAIARRGICQILLARFVVLHVFREQVRLFGVSDEAARQKWLVLQLRPDSVLDCDIFLSLVNDSDNRPFDHITKDLLAFVPQFDGLLEFIAVDEAQIAGRALSTAFATSDRRLHRPLLAELVASLASMFPKQRLVVSGVEASYDVVHDALASSGSSRMLRHFHSLGSFESTQRFTLYVQHFDALRKIDCAGVFSWLCGRHRILAVFLMYCLVAGFSHWSKVLDTMISLLTGHRRPSWPPLPDVSLGLLLPNERLDGSGLGWHLRRAAYTYALHGRQSVLLEEHPHRLVTVGLGAFCPSSAASPLPLAIRIYEPLVFLNLMRWLNSSTRYSFPGLIRTMLDDTYLAVHEIAQDAAFLEASALALWDLFWGGGGPLSELVYVATFAPPWMTVEASLRLTSCDGRQPRQFIEPRGSCRRNLITFAQNAGDCFAWFARASTPFLITPPGFGADMLFILELEGGHIVLVCFQLHRQPIGNLRRRLSMVVTNPSTYLSKDPNAQIQWLQILETFPTLPYNSSNRQCKFPTLQIVCFAKPYPRDTGYNPPVGVLKPETLISSPTRELTDDVLTQILRSHP